MYADLTKLVKNLLKRFVKVTVIQTCEFGAALRNIDITNKDDLVRRENIRLGFSAETSIAEMKKAKCCLL